MGLCRRNTGFRGLTWFIGCRGLYWGPPVLGKAPGIQELRLGSRLEELVLAPGEAGPALVGS